MQQDSSDAEIASATLLLILTGCLVSVLFMSAYAWDTTSNVYRRRVAAFVVRVFMEDCDTEYVECQSNGSDD